MLISVYWIKKPEHTDMRTEGYIGISNDVGRRFQEHKYGRSIVSKAIRKYTNVELVVLDILDLDSALDLEKQLRPGPFIGWNQVEGGGIPPSRAGSTASEETRKKQSAAHKGKPKSVEHLAKLKIATFGKQPDMTGSKRVVIECPHCHTSGGVNGMVQWHFDKCKARRD